MIDLMNVRKVFNAGTVNENVAIGGLSLNIDKGEFVTVIGSNGAGKSTMLNLIAGILTPDGGNVVVNGRDITKMPDYKRAKFIGSVFQDPLSGTAKSLTIEENMAIAHKRGQGRWFAKGVNRKNRHYFAEKLADLGLGLENRLKTNAGLLSGGQRQCLTLLMAVMANPEILLLDEHTAALDPRTAELVMNLTKRLADEMNLTCLMVTHNMKQAIEFGSRIIMMHGGEIVVDVKGADKKGLTVKDLLQMFEQVKGSGIDDDKLLLGV
ncbi:ABC transporter ATP-binding protein [Seleniivibrio woodruffii]|uniref:ABC transporter ATP-binding protein n=1 Tax=Seleniivibrio woodruffii TaxID=1078050 RepID=UPI002409269E|nr:ABC transporter ATP-binding protein [Seleniivibrio woodruffii]